jgi:hypothetical protein
MSIFGDLERFLADLYPYRVPITLAAVACAVAFAWVVGRRGWHRPVLRLADANRALSALLIVVVLAVGVPTGYYLLSPLWQRTTLVEASPLDPGLATSSASTSGAASTATVDLAASPSATPDGAGSAPTAEDSAEPALLAAGEFVGADDFHFARGRALLIESGPGDYVLRFEEFSIRNGPDLYVYLSPSADEPAEGAIRLGTLKATDGAFNYELPAGTDLEGLDYAMVWCDQFAVLFGAAELE